MNFFDLDSEGDSMLNTVEIDKISNEHNICTNLQLNTASLTKSPSDRLNQGNLLVDLNESHIPTTSATCKRKSLDNFTDFKMNNVKRQSIEPVIIDDDYFQTQFFRQIDQESAAAEAAAAATTTSKTKLLNKNDLSKETENLSQMFFSQFDTGIWSQVKALKLTQLFGDDDDNDDDTFQNESTKQQSSQRFLSDIQKLDHVIEASQQKHHINSQNVPEINNYTIYKSKNASEYMELQRTMQEINEDNVNDDNFLDQELSQAYKSSQYRREILSEINQCERSVADISNLPPPEENIDVPPVMLPQVDDINWTEKFVTSPIRNKVVDRYKSSQQPGTSKLHPHESQLANIENMNWTEKFDLSPMRNNTTAVVRPLAEMTPTKIIRERLLANKIRLGMIESPPRCTRATTTTSKGFTNLGPFFGLPLQVQRLIKDFKGIDHLYDWQKECLTLPAIERRNNLIYALPTSGGKTLVAEILILREIMSRQKNCLLILPYVSIVQEKLWAMSPFAVQLDFLLEEYAAGKGSLPPRKRRKKKSVYIATIEKGLALIDSLIEADRIDELGLIVIDELHLIGEIGRGVVLETLLTKTIFIDAGIQIVGMSATIGNLNEIAQFLNADVYTRNFRPVELEEFIKCGSDILKINTKAECLEDAFTYERTVSFKYKENIISRDPDHLAGLVSEVIPDNSCLVFCSSKNNCESVSMLLANLLSKNYIAHKVDEKNELLAAIKSDVGSICKILATTIPFGIAYHHAGLTSDERRHIEDAFRRNVLCVICCTSTLAAGVNLPAKRVIIRSPYIGRDFITLSRYKQMIGRAGRAGMGNGIGESIIICSQRDNAKLAELLCSPMDEAASGMHLNDAKGLRSLILSAIGLKLAVCQNDLEKLIEKTLMATQSKRLCINVRSEMKRAIRQLFQMKVLAIKIDSCSSENTGMLLLPSSSSSPAASIVLSDSAVEFDSEDPSITTVSEQSPIPSTSKMEIKSNSAAGKVTAGINKKRFVIKPSTELEINPFGRAAYKSCIDLNKAKIMYNDLQEAQKSLVLVDYLHLLYIVTPYEPAEINVQPDMTVYYAKYSKLSDSHRQTTKILGISESCAMKFISGKRIGHPNLQRIVNRFFLTLILHELWHYKPIHEVAEQFHVNRGIVQNLITASAAYASGVVKFCEELPEFWAFKELLTALTKRLSYCCAHELIPLMELPCVKLARAKQLYAAGFKNLEAIAKAKIKELTDSVEHLTPRVARQLISAAKVLLLERVETLREEVQDYLEVLERQ